MFGFIAVQPSVRVQLQQADFHFWLRSFSSQLPQELLCWTQLLFSLCVCVFSSVMIIIQLIFSHLLLLLCFYCVIMWAMTVSFFLFSALYFFRLVLFTIKIINPNCFCQCVDVFLGSSHCVILCWFKLKFSMKSFTLINQSAVPVLVMVVNIHISLKYSM